jgi:hypothetical protein
MGDGVAMRRLMMMLVLMGALALPGAGARAEDEGTLGAPTVPPSEGVVDERVPAPPKDEAVQDEALVDDVGEPARLGDEDEEAKPRARTEDEADAEEREGETGDEEAFRAARDMHFADDDEAYEAAAERFDRANERAREERIEELGEVLDHLEQ